MKIVTQLFDGDTITGVSPGLASTVESVFLREVVVQGGLPSISPGSKVVQTATDFLRPSVCSVREEREVRVRFGGLAGRRRRGRILFGHGNDS
jgi:hypothetical protein